MYQDIFEPEIESVAYIIAAVCPNEADQDYLDVLALPDPEDPVEAVIKHFYEHQEEPIPPEILPLFLRSPFYVSWHTDPNGLQYRVVVIDNRGVAALYSSLSRFTPED